MKLSIPPLVQFLIGGLLSWSFASLFDEATLSIPLGSGLGLLLIGIGTGILALSVLSFIRAKTTVNPVSPENASVLVTNGLYRYSRNPMYLAMAMVLIGYAFLVQNLAAFAGPILFMVGMTILQIKPEEQVLREKFGDEYEAYCNQTRRWL